MKPPSPKAGQTKFQLIDLSLVCLSISIQLILGLFFGHAYDMRIFMATGYLVSTGQNPYIPQDLTAIFQNAFFQGMTSVGYPPPWPLLLGLIYRGVNLFSQNLLLYNLAIKLPIIAANIGLAYTVAAILRTQDCKPGNARKAWIFMLFSPILFYFGSAWGQFDAIAALLALLALLLLQTGRQSSSALCLALSISLKPIALPILPVVLIYLWGKSARQAGLYFLITSTSLILFCVAPFFVWDWDPSPILHGWNAHFTVGGGMAWMTFIELLKDNYQLPGWLWLLGLLWIPALGVGIFSLRHGIDDFLDLLKKCTAMILIFFLTRTWLSEPNIILLLPFTAILTALGQLDRLALVGVTILPLIFTIFNASPPQLLFPSHPVWMTYYLQVFDEFRTVRLLGRILLVLPWQFLGWWIVYCCYKKAPQAARPA